MAELEEVLQSLAEDMSARTDRGAVAGYIPQLRKADPQRFGIAVALNDGRVVTAGDADEPFSIQSISKIFTLTLALGKVGDALWRRVGREPSGNPFNSIVQLEREMGIPRNPFINAGAVVVTDVLLAGHQPREALGEILRFIQFLADDDSIIIDRDVAASERATGYRNFALANYMRAFDNLEHEPELALGVYFHHCAIAMSCRQLALSTRFLAHEGRNPQTGHSVVSAERARRILALMLTCGHYDGSGDFAFRVGIPGKSGVGGGIVGIVPGIASIAVWSPGLNENGNSKLGSVALERLTRTMNWSIFAP
ncbi:glutaminase [Mesorhizobium sp. SP-1A]|uniref:glutaminase n=1 Tax=Mesorhizobium sp. SP-1A TaxID=3077840 RepID=UPI0028F700B6|nr:glutaminase [Mesorhizobium sp. SP-1A]